MKLNTILAAVCIIMAISLCVVPYYWIDGLAIIFIALPLLLLELGLMVWLGIRLYKPNKKMRKVFQKFSFYANIVLAVASLFIEVPIEFLDWHLRKPVRNEIVLKVKNGVLKPNAQYNKGICSLGNSYFPPLSNGGNEIIVEYGKVNSVTVEFFINRGFLDNYSAFVYTDDNEKIKELEDRIKSEIPGNRILGNNWYRVSY
ncbi:MAG: hypothetical protein ACM3Q2_04160 [Syntrophothermus sp.]